MRRHNYLSLFHIHKTGAIVAFLLATGIATSGVSCVNRSAPHSPAPAAVTARPAVEFLDVTSDSGINFVQTNGATGEKYLPETMGAGCAFIDYDNDGWMDILLINSAEWTTSVGKKSTLHLYRNDHHG